MLAVLAIIVAALLSLVVGFILGALTAQPKPAADDCSDCADRVLAALQGMENRIMAKMDEFNAKMGQIDEATNEIASDLEALRNDVANGLSADQTATALSTLDAKIARLRQLGADPENPVPPTE